MIARLLLRHRFPLAGAVLALCGVASILVAAALSADASAETSAPPETAAPDPASAPARGPFPDPFPDAEPLPEPEPPPPPVEGTLADVEVLDLSTSGTGLFQPGSGRDRPVTPDGEAIDAFVAAMAAWLDDAITDANLGTGPDESATGLDDAARSLAWAATGSPVARADYTVRVGARGEPEWGEVAVAARRTDGSVRHAVLVFAPTADAPVVLAADAGSVEPGSAGSDGAGSDDAGSDDAGSDDAGSDGAGTGNVEADAPPDDDEERETA